ncbi:membrane-spanning 4-domains subfamily A member 4A-like [Mustelus asterias]
MSSAVESNPTSFPPATSATLQVQHQQKPFHKFLKGEPKALGITLTMLGIIQLSFGIPIWLAGKSYMTTMGVPWWLAALLLTSGSLTILCNQRPNKAQVTACLATNIIHTIATGIALTIMSVDISLWNGTFIVYQEQDSDFLHLWFAMKSILLFLGMCGMIISIVISIFCCKGLRYCSPNTSMPVVIIHNASSETPSCTSHIPSK